MLKNSLYNIYDYYIMISRRNTGVNANFNHSADFARVVKTVNPQNEILIKPPFKPVKSRSGESIENRNFPKAPKTAKPFSINF